MTCVLTRRRDWDMDTYRGATWENMGGVIHKARAEASKKATGDTVALDSIPRN